MVYVITQVASLKPNSCVFAQKVGKAGVDRMSYCYTRFSEFISSCACVVTCGSLCMSSSFCSPNVHKPANICCSTHIMPSQSGCFPRFMANMADQTTWIADHIMINKSVFFTYVWSRFMNLTSEENHNKWGLWFRTPRPPYAAKAIWVNLNIFMNYAFPYVCWHFHFCLTLMATVSLYIRHFLVVGARIYDIRK